MDKQSTADFTPASEFGRRFADAVFLHFLRQPGAIDYLLRKLGS